MVSDGPDLKEMQMRLEILHVLVADLYESRRSSARLERRLDELRRRHSARRAAFERALAEIMAPIQEALDQQERDPGGT